MKWVRSYMEESYDRHTAECRLLPDEKRDERRNAVAIAESDESPRHYRGTTLRVLIVGSG